MITPSLVAWCLCGSTVTLVYSDGDEFSVFAENFNRFFGAIVSHPKEQIRYEFAISR